MGSRDRVLDRVALAGAVLAAGLFFVLLGTTDRVPAADGPHMLFVARRIGADLLAGHPLQAAGFWLHLAIPHPPAGYLPSILLTPLPLRWAVAGASTLCLLLLLDALLRLSRPAPRWTAVAAWLLAAGAGLTWWSADHYGFDLPAAAVTLQALSWLQASDRLRKTRETLLFGLWLGAGFLTKYSVPLLCLLPVVAVCGSTVFARPLARAPLRLLVAVAAWAALAAPVLALNGHQILGYVTSALAPPGGPGNYPNPLTLVQRFGGSGQVSVAAAMKEALGYPGLVLAVAAALVARRAVPLLGLVSGFVLLGAMNSREGRYVLPLLFLLAAAAVPRPAPGGWRSHLATVSGVLLLAVGVVGFAGSAWTWATTSQAAAAAHHPFQHVSTTFRTLGGWPRPAGPFQPISEHPVAWRVDEVNEAIRTHFGGDAPLLLLLDGPADAPGLSTLALLALEDGARPSYLELHAQADRGGVRVLTTLPPGQSVDHVYVVHARGERPDSPVSAGRAWLAATPHTVVASWDLPQDYVGRLVVLASPFAGGGTPVPFQGGEGG